MGIQRTGALDMQGKAEETGFDQPKVQGGICLQYPVAENRVIENTDR